MSEYIRPQQSEQQRVEMENQARTLLQYLTQFERHGIGGVEVGERREGKDTFRELETIHLKNPIAIASRETIEVGADNKMHALPGVSLRVVGENILEEVVNIDYLLVFDYEGNWLPTQSMVGLGTTGYNNDESAMKGTVVPGFEEIIEGTLSRRNPNNKQLYRITDSLIDTAIDRARLEQMADIVQCMNEGLQ